MNRSLPMWACLTPLLTVATVAAAQQVPGGPPAGGVDREQMWPAPTAEDWRRPVGIVFQRTWEDAVVVSRETGKPILICVNMDGEIASEHYAGIRYRQPEIAELYEPYVCVIASVYRHTPRDHDQHGNRILCPRFGSVTCGEHIAIEPILYEKFFDGKRIAPRHIMVELDGSEQYDVYYAWDTDSVFQAIEDGIANREQQPVATVRGDRPVVERVASRDVADRQVVEEAYRDGDEALRRSLLEAAEQHVGAAPDELLRLAVFGFDPQLSALARRALAKSESEGSIDLIAEALRVPMEESDRDALIGSLQRIGESSPRARTLAVVHRGLASRSREVDVDGWSSAMQGGATYAPAPEWSVLDARLGDQGRAAEATPEDPAARLELAEASLRLAVDPKTLEILAADRRTGSRYGRLMFEDAQRAAVEAEQLGATGWRVDAVIALSAYYLGDLETAYARAEKAVPAIPTGEQDWSAIATIALFAQARQQAIQTALRQKQDWPGEWLTDVNAAYAVLAEHPLGTDVHVAAHYDFLRSLGASAQAGRVLDAGLTRFPESWPLHDCLRGRILADRGVEGLDEVYDEMLARPDAAPNLAWFAGLASIVAAEFSRRTGDDDRAIAEYERAIAHYEDWIERNPDNRATADHYAALALAGEARLALERRDLERALERVLASFERKPDAAASLDGLNISPVDTAKMLLARLKAEDRADLALRLEAALAALDPKMLELPAYEQRVPGRGRPGRPGRRGR